MDKGAIISPCGKYRYQLWRIWDDSKPICMFVMHNPSTADGNMDDPTIRRCIGFAASWGYGGIYIGNLSPYRATNPKDMIGLDFLVLCPMDNMFHINEMVKKCSLHVFAYGNPITDDLKPELWDTHWHYLSLTKDGNPGHPLYLRKDLKPIKYISNTKTS